MALRFRKSIKLAPGIRMNLSGSGASFSFGGRGASVTVGNRGPFLNTGIPGTGISSRQKLDGPSSSRNSASSWQRTVDVAISVGMSHVHGIGFRLIGEIWFGIAALLTGIISCWVTDLTMQTAIFVVLSALSFAVGWFGFLKNAKSRSQAGQVKESILGERGIVSAVKPGAFPTGKVRFSVAVLGADDLPSSAT